MKIRASALLLLAALPLATGCGPTVPPQLAVHAVPLTNLVLGKPTDVEKRPVNRDLLATLFAPKGTHQPQFGGLPQFPPPLFSGGFPNLPPPAAVCADLSATAAAVDAPDEVASTATNGVYSYRTPSADINDGGATSKVITPANGTRTITGAQNPGTGQYAFTETWLLGPLSFATNIAATNATANPAGGVVAAAASQVGLSRFQLYSAAPGSVIFSPSTPLILMKTPASGNGVTPGYQTWKDAQSDPAHGSSMRIDGAITGKVRVNACGTAIDAWEVQATITLVSAPPTDAPLGQVGGPTNLTITATYEVATGLGGQIVQESQQWSGTLDGQSISADWKSTLNSPNPAPLKTQ